LANEAKLLSKCDHENLVKLYGICFETNNRPKYIIMEYMSLGDLLSYLKKLRNENNFKINSIKTIKMIIQILNGCVYLEENKMVHR
jgi:serine/threonine protein kinase